MLVHLLLCLSFDTIFSFLSFLFSLFHTFSSLHHLSLSSFHSSQTRDSLVTQKTKKDKQQAATLERYLFIPFLFLSFFVCRIIPYDRTKRRRRSCLINSPETLDTWQRRRRQDFQLRDKKKKIYGTEGSDYRLKDSLRRRGKSWVIIIVVMLLADFSFLFLLLGKMCFMVQNNR